MVVFPAVSAAISLICAAVMARDAVARPRPDKVAWAIAFALFAVAAGAEVLGSLTEWSATLARVYYLAGAVLVVGYLALGQLYLLAAKRIAHFAPGVALLATAVSITVVWNAKVDEARLAADGWEALERGPALKALAIGLNAGGTLVIVGGLLYSAWRFKRLGTQRDRMIGCLLIAVGTLTVAMGGTLTRLGHREYLYIAMAAGVAIIFAGVLQTRRPGTSRQPTADSGQETASELRRADSKQQTADSGRERVGDAVAAPSVAVLDGSANGHAVAGLNGHVAPVPAPIAADPAIAFIEARLLPLDADRLAEECRIWSVPPVVADAFERETARAVWALRCRLAPAAQERFDALPVPARLQLAELYHDVLSGPGSAPLLAERRVR